MRKFFLMLGVLVGMGLLLNVLQPIAEAVVNYYLVEKGQLQFFLEAERELDPEDEVMALSKEQTIMLEQHRSNQEEELQDGGFILESEQSEYGNPFGTKPETEARTTDNASEIITELNPGFQEDLSLRQNRGVMGDEYTGFEIQTIIRDIKQEVDEESFEIETIHLEEADAFLTMIYKDGFWHVGDYGMNEVYQDAKIVRIRARSSEYEYEFKVDLNTSEIISVRKTVLLNK